MDLSSFSKLAIGRLVVDLISMDNTVTKEPTIARIVGALDLQPNNVGKELLHIFDPGGSKQGGQPSCIINMLKEMVKNKKVKPYEFAMIISDCGTAAVRKGVVSETSIEVGSAENDGGMSLVNMVYNLVKAVGRKESEEDEGGMRENGDTKWNGSVWAAVNQVFAGVSFQVSVVANEVACLTDSRLCKVTTILKRNGKNSSLEHKKGGETIATPEFVQVTHDMLKEMKINGTTLDEITNLCILSACAREGLSKEDWCFFEIFGKVGSRLHIPNQSLLHKDREISDDIQYQGIKQGKRGRRKDDAPSQSPRTGENKIATCEFIDIGRKDVDEPLPIEERHNKVLSGGENDD